MEQESQWKKAVRENDLDAIISLHAKSIERDPSTEQEITIDICTPEIADMAAYHGHIKILSFLLKNRNEGCTVLGILSAAENGHFDVVRCLYNHVSWSQEYLFDNEMDITYTMGMGGGSMFGGYCQVAKMCMKSTMRLDIREWLPKRSITIAFGKSWFIYRMRKNMRNIIWNLRLKRNYYIRVSILCKPGNYLGTTEAGLLYEQDARNIFLSH